MESAADCVEPSEARSEPVGEKRPASEDVDVLKEGSPHKRIRGGGERSFVGDVKKVAEMVLVLAAMGKMRAGKGPTDVEKELMAEARNRLAKVCEGFAPKDVFPRDAFGGVIEDLGLNKLKDQRLGFRPPKMSIAEKLLVSKRKMEKAENFSLPSTPHSSRLHPNSGAAVENRNPSHLARISHPDKASHMSISSGSFQLTSPLAHSTQANSTSLPYQLPSSEVRPMTSSALPSSHFGSAAMQRVDRPQLKSDGRPNGASHSSQIHANYSANPPARTPTWSMQPLTALSSKGGSDSKVPVNVSLKVEGAAAVAPQTMSRTGVAQIIGGSPAHSTNHVQPPLGNTHVEIGKIVQKLLQPQFSEQPTWNPPSRDYMNKALTCQMCMSTVTDIDNILICDACEKGYHLKCLQTSNQKGVPRGEWHCGKCLSLSHGKPLPPKYGRVMRNINTPKVSSNSAAVPSTSSKSGDASDEKFSQSNIIINENSRIENTNSEVSGNNFSHSTSLLQRKECKEMQKNDHLSSRVKMDDKESSGIYPNNLMKTSSSASVSSANSLTEKISVPEVAELKPNRSEELAMVPNSSDKSQTIVNAVEASPSKQSQENHVVRDSKESNGVDSSNNTNQQNEQEVVCDNPTENASSAVTMNQGRSSSDGLRAVDWVGEPIRVLDDKIYYSSCCINEHLYEAMDHVLIRIESDKLIPAKIQAMWEDKNTTTKWVTVNQCYFPGDLPEAVGRPCGLESREVYESTCGKAVMAGSIESPCEVLPPRKFAEETESRNHSGKQLNDNLPPIYVCKWIYDEAKGLFRDISC
ncbi:hypothetical protein ACP275_13G102900 [Erythranthe tilingii]